MNLQYIGRLLTKGYSPLMVVLCMAMLCGHVLPVVSSLTVFHIFVAVTAMLAMLLRAPMPRLYYVVAAYFLFYTVWTIGATMLWPQELGLKEVLKFCMIAISSVALLRMMLASPGKMLRLFFYVCIGYVLLMTGIGVVEHLSGWHLPTSAYYGQTPPSRIATGLSYNQNDYSVLLVMAALYVFAYSTLFMGKKASWVGYIAIGLSLPMLWWNECLTGIAAVGIAIVYHLVRTQVRKQSVAICYCMALAVIVAACVGVVLAWPVIEPRLKIYALSVSSLFDSYGLGFGINGDKFYLSRVNNYEITHGLTNAHSYLLQILFTSGLPVFLFYCLVIVNIMAHSAKNGRNLLWLMPILYLILLFSPSSALYMWGHYVFFCVYVCYAVYVAEQGAGSVEREAGSGQPTVRGSYRIPVFLLARIMGIYGSWSGGGPVMVRGWSGDGPIKDGQTTEGRRCGNGTRIVNKK